MQQVPYTKPVLSHLPIHLNFRAQAHLFIPVTLLLLIRGPDRIAFGTFDDLIQKFSRYLCLEDKTLNEDENRPT
jgi:hypothetical protein